ncbi:sensor histidine kinase, partial [Shinella sp.]|uniref:sensor histidine kinase n=1 Tax=Shinella sp. TaxID=1870904 RepID=UPI003F6E4969
NAVGESAMAMAIPLFAFVVVGGLAVWMIVNRVLSPIEELGQAIDDKNEANLAPVDLRRIPNELMPVVRSVNFLLERLRKAFDDEREFTAHSAHELRTPIAGALAQIQCLGNDLPEGAWKQRAATVENSLRMLGRFVERLLQLAKANSQVTMKSGIIDVGPVLDMLVADFQRDRLTGQRLQYNRAVTAPLVHNLDVDGFWIVMRNLIENAIAYGEPNTPVIVSVATDGSIRIANECAVMSNVTLETVRNRFVRGNNNVPGSGLGLAIADQMLKQMGGTLHLYSPALGRDTGFEAVIAFQSVEPGEEKAVCAPGTIG